MTDKRSRVRRGAQTRSSASGGLSRPRRAAESGVHDREHRQPHEMTCSRWPTWCGAPGRGQTGVEAFRGDPRCVSGNHARQDLWGEPKWTSARAWRRPSAYTKCSGARIAVNRGGQEPQASEGDRPPQQKREFPAVAVEMNPFAIEAWAGTPSKGCRSTRTEHGTGRSGRVRGRRGRAGGDGGSCRRGVVR